MINSLGAKARTLTDPPSTLIEEQRASNRSQRPHYDSFATHRERVSSLVASRAGAAASSRLCVLGAGNCYDLDLVDLATRFREIHLVDLDEEAVAEARGRQPPETQTKITLHAPLDLSGFLGSFERFRRMDVTPEELLRHPAVVARKLAGELEGPFDVVVSGCVLTQMQLSLLTEVGDRHRLFEALRQTLNLTHLRTLAALIGTTGRALLLSDVTSNAMYTPLNQSDPSQSGLSLLKEALASKQVIYATHPELLRWAAREDPVLSRDTELSEPLEAWLWHDGPKQTFLVYALEMKGRGG